MFEQASYSVGAGTLKLSIWYFLFINIGFLIFGFAGHFIVKLSKVSVPGILKILIGYSFYSTLAWHLYKTGHSQDIMPLFVALVVCIAILTSIVAKRANHFTISTFPQTRPIFRKIAPLIVIELVVILVWTGFLVEKPFHILVSGNNDVYFWGFMSDHVMGSADLERINRGQGGNNLVHQVIDCFGVYGWLGFLGKLSMKGHAIEAVMLFQLSISILAAWLIYEISAVVIGTTRIAALIPAIVFSFNPLWIYVFTNNFLSQLLATFCFLSAVYIIGHSAESSSSTKNYFLSGFLFYVCFVFSYPGLLVPYAALILGSMAVFKYLVWRALGQGPWKEIGKSLIGVSAGAIFASIIYYDLTLYAFNRFLVLSNAAAGWPLSMLDPLNLLGFISYSLDRTIFSNWLTYLFVTFTATAILFVRVFRNRRTTISSAKYDSLLLLSIIALVSYLGVYYVKGDSYQQWKFAAYFPLPLLVLSVVNYFAPKSRD